MRILHEKFAPNVRLPFNVIKGNVNQRDQKSKAYFAKFYNKIQEITKDKKSCPLRQTCMILKEVLAPYDIQFEILKEKNKNCLGSFNISDKYIKTNDDIITIYNEKYQIFLPLQKSKNIIYDKYTLYHEVQHFFDYLFNPKFVLLKEDKIFINENLEKRRDSLYSVIFENLNTKTDMKTIKKDVHKILANIPTISAIYLLQETRYSLKTEINAYITTIKCQLKNRQFKEAYEDFKFFKQNCMFTSKLNFINKLLKNLLKQERIHIKEYYTNLQHNPNNLVAL